MKRLVCMLLIVSITCLGCGGSAPNPISIYQPGDENKSCSSLRATIANIDKQVARKENLKGVKTLGNIMSIVGGFFTLGIMWFFVDLKNAEQVEIDAFEQRKDALLVIAAENKCGTAEEIAAKSMVP